MKKKAILPVLAFLFAIISAFATANMQDFDYQDDNGSPGGTCTQIADQSSCSTSGTTDCISGQLVYENECSSVIKKP